MGITDIFGGFGTGTGITGISEIFGRFGTGTGMGIHFWTLQLYVVCTHPTASLFVLEAKSPKDLIPS